MYSQRAEKQLPFKWYPRLGKYKASNVEFDPKLMEAYSYNWWKFLDVINGKIVFNNYRYSNSTSKHQSKLQNLLYQLDLPAPDLFIECPQGLNDLNSAITHYQGKIKELKSIIEKPKTHRNKNNERLILIKEYQWKINQIKKLKGQK